MCNHPECLEGIRFEPQGSVIQVGYGYIDGLKFSAIIRDSRYEGTEHLHFPARDFDVWAQGVGVDAYGAYAARDAQARKVPPPDVIEEAIVPLERGSRRFSAFRRDRHDAR